MTYQTEAERLAAREAFVAQCLEVWNDTNPTGEYYRTQFDHAFPPLAPVRMTPFRGHVVANPDGSIEDCDFAVGGDSMRETHAAMAKLLPEYPGSRVAEVEVREVGSEPEGVPCKMVVNPEYPADKHFWYSRNHPDFPPHYIITPGRFVADGEAPLSRHHERGV